MKAYIVKLRNGKFYFEYMELAKDAKDAKKKAKEKTSHIVVSARKL